MYAGTYAEEITIDRTLTLLGPNAGINPNVGARVAEAVIVPTFSDPLNGGFAGPQIVTLTADGVTFNGFTVDGDNPTLTSGVLYNGADVDAEIGMYGTETANPDAAVTNNIFKNIGEIAVYLTSNNVGAPKDAASQIANNKVDNCFGAFGEGIRISDDAWVSVLANVVTRVRIGIVMENYTGAGTPSTHPASVIGDNNVTAFRIGIWQNLHQAYAPPGFTISNNVVNSYVQSVRPPQVTAIETPVNRYQGIREESIRGTDFATVSGNILTGNRAAMTAAGYIRVEGLYVTNESSTSPNISFDHNKVTDFIRGAFNDSPVVPTFTCNIFQGNTTGLYNKTDPGNPPPPFGNLIVNNNNIAGNGFGLQNDEAAAVNAKQNWWGAANGPGPVGPGSGDKVSTNVDFSNFLTSVSGCVPPPPKTDQQISFGALANKTFGDADFTVSATASSGLAVSFSAMGNCTVSGNLVHITGAGSCTMTALQGGDSNYNPAPDVMQTFTIAKATTGTSVASSANPSDFGENVTLFAIVRSFTALSGAPTGTVQFKDGATNLGGAVSCIPSGAISCTAQSASTSTLTVGLHNISYTYSGDTNFLGSISSLGQVVRAQPSLSINDVSLAEGDSGTKNFNFTVTLSAASNLTVKVDFATANGTATAGSDYVATNGTLTFNPGDLTKTITVLVNGEQLFEPDETFTVNLTNAVNATISKAAGTGTILNDDAQGGIISFSQSNYSVNEDAGSLIITVNRTGDTSGPATVDYATSDDSNPASPVPCAPSGNGIASSRCDFMTTVGTLKFAAGDKAKSFVVLINDDSYVGGAEAFTVTLSNLTGGAVFAAPSTATVTINDVQPVSQGNLIDIANFFVTEHYHEFLNREPDLSGLDFWTKQITSCGSDAQCIDAKRVNVSAAFYLSIEFQETGGYAIRVQRSAFGKKSQDSTRVTFLQFITDSQFVGNGVIIGVPGADAKLSANKDAYATQVATSTAFTTAYPASLTADQFVTALFNTAGVTPTSAEKNAAVAAFGAGGTAGRTAALRSVADSNSVRTAEFSPAFVLMEFYGYLRRNPDTAGYNFWLTKLNNFGGDAIKAEMVRSFILSTEYRQRFGP